jgi:hypothetical protein
MKILLLSFKLIPLPVTIILLAVPACWLLLRSAAEMLAEAYRFHQLKKCRVTA